MGRGDRWSDVALPRIADLQRRCSRRTLVPTHERAAPDLARDEAARTARLPSVAWRTAPRMAGPFRQIENRFRGMKRQFLMVQQSFCLAEENLIKTQSLCMESVRY